MITTVYRCEKTSAGLRILEIRGLDGDVVIQEMIGGQPVCELVSYLSGTEHPDSFYVDGDGNPVTSEQALEIPLVKGLQVEKIHMPKSIQRVGRYCMYNCEHLKELELYSTTLDWGNGAFFGCINMDRLIVHVDENTKSCLKELLAEFKQTLRVTYLGKERAELIFGRYFEEVIENTPARLINTDIKGCGMKYRNAFLRSQFQFAEYDSLFKWMAFEELAETAIELAEKRLRYPAQLGRSYREIYEAYLQENRLEAGMIAVDAEDMDLLRWLVEKENYPAEELGKLIDAANRKNRTAAVSFLMEQQRGNVGQRKRRFSL